MLNFCIVFLGGGLGAVLRYLLSIQYPNSSEDFPLATLLANLLACFLLGIITTWSSKNQVSPQVALAIGTGFCGGLSTFSTFSKESSQLLQQNLPLLSLIYIATSLFLGLLAFYAGILCQK